MSTTMALAGGNRGDAASGNGSVQLQTGGAHGGGHAAKRGSQTSPRRAVVALNSQPKAESSPATVYDKQLLWKQHGLRKVDHKTLELLGQEDAECTFNPKINKTLVYQQQLVRKARAPTSTMQAALSPTASEFLMSDGVSYSDCSSQYTDSPRTMRSVEMETEAAATGYADEEEEELAAGPVFPTESHESSILLHLARQERAREEAQKAHQKLVSRQPSKDFTKVTTPRPFGLSVTNRKPRSTSASPTNRTTRSLSQPKGRSSSTVAGSKQPLNRRPHGAVSTTEDTSGDHATTETVADETKTSHAVATAMENQALMWQKERASLLSIIETQRRELEQRDQSHADAARLADSFSVTMQSFAQRLEVVERATATELSEMKQLLAKQTAATELLLHALGLNCSSTAPGPSPASSSSKTSGGGLTLSPSSPPSSPPPHSSASTAGLRRETK